MLHVRRQMLVVRLGHAVEAEPPQELVGRHGAGPQDLGEPPVPQAPRELHLEQPVLGMGEAEREGGIGFARGPDGGDAHGVAPDLDGRPRSLQRDRAAEPRQGELQGGPKPGEQQQQYAGDPDQQPASLPAKALAPHGKGPASIGRRAAACSGIADPPVAPRRPGARGTSFMTGYRR